MKPQLHKLPVEQNASFLFNQWKCKHFDKPWHFHEEYELVLIQKSKGTKFIGNHVGLFNEGDLYLIGSNIPHLFRNHEDYYEEGSNLEARSMYSRLVARPESHGSGDRQGYQARLYL